MTADNQPGVWGELVFEVAQGDRRIGIDTEDLRGELATSLTVALGQKDGGMFLIGDNHLGVRLPGETAEHIVDAVGGIAVKGDPVRRHAENTGNGRTGLG